MAGEQDKDKDQTQTGQDTDPPADDFEAAFNEFAGGTDKTDDDPPPDGGRDGDGADGADDKDDGAATNDAAGAADDPPADKAGTEKKSASDGGDKEAQDKKDGGDDDDVPPAGVTREVWAKAPPEVRDAFKRTASGYQEQLRRRLVEIERLKGKPATPPAKQKPKSVLDDPELKKAKEEYPEVFGPLEKTIKALEERVGKADEALEGLNQERTDAYIAEQERQLAKDHPDWQTVTAKDSFGQWLVKQPRAIREAAIRNGQGIVDAEEASLVIGLYKQQTGQAQTNPPDNGAGSGGGKGTSTTDTRRKRQLEATAVTSKGPGGGAQPPDDFEQAFNYYASKRKPA